eukprot:851519-Ditylum_brightwellii.AAC.1
MMACIDENELSPFLCDVMESNTRSSPCPFHVLVILCASSLSVPDSAEYAALELPSCLEQFVSTSSSLSHSSYAPSNIQDSCASNVMLKYCIPLIPPHPMMKV